ncbi:hypothetical protein ACJZ2D_014285 [Fusarium nematophilum]
MDVSSMRLSITGATGRPGGFAFEYALDQDTKRPLSLSHEPMVFSLAYLPSGHRTASRLASRERLTISEGSVLSEVDMDRAFSSSGRPFDAVIHFLDASRKSVSPWSEFIGPVHLLLDPAAWGGQGTGDSIKTAPLYLSFLIDHGNLAKRSCVDASDAGCAVQCWGATCEDVWDDGGGDKPVYHEGELCKVDGGCGGEEAGDEA